MSVSSETKEWARLADMDLATAHHLFATFYPKPLEMDLETRARIRNGAALESNNRSRNERVLEGQTEADYATEFAWRGIILRTFAHFAVHQAHGRWSWSEGACHTGK